MHRVHLTPLTGLAGVVVLLTILAQTADLGGLGWLVGVGSGAAVTAFLSRGLVRHQVSGLGPADEVTLARAVLACGVAAMTADSFAHPVRLPVLIVLSTVALFLDAVDGRVARRTHTESVLGARFDMEIDAFMILVLSVYVAESAGWWVLVIGAARYLFVAAGRVVPWLRGSLPPRPWCKVVAALQAVVLTVAAAGIVTSLVSDVAIAVALLLLVESFGRETWGLWCLRAAQRQRTPRPDIVVVSHG